MMSNPIGVWVLVTAGHTDRFLLPCGSSSSRGLFRPTTGTTSCIWSLLWVLLQPGSFTGLQLWEIWIMMEAQLWQHTSIILWLNRAPAQAGVRRIILVRIHCLGIFSVFISAHQFHILRNVCRKPSVPVMELDFTRNHVTWGSRCLKICPWN